MANPSPARFDAAAKRRLGLVLSACSGPTIVLAALCACYTLGMHGQDAVQRWMMAAVLLVAAVGCGGAGIALLRHARQPGVRQAHDWLCHTGSLPAVYSIRVLLAFGLIAALLVSDV